MAKTARKLTAKQVARFQAIRARQASNDNAPIKSAYVDTNMTPGMLAACVEAAGFPG